MKIIKIFDDVKLVLVQLEVNLGKQKRQAPTLCAQLDDKIIPLNTPDGRPILMNFDNAI